MADKSKKCSDVKKEESKQGRQTVNVKPRSYQQTKAEIRERAYLPTTPERAAKAVASLVNIKETEDPG